MLDLVLDLNHFFLFLTNDMQRYMLLTGAFNCLVPPQCTLVIVT